MNDIVVCIKKSKTVIITTTFPLYQRCPEGIHTLFELSRRISQETGLQTEVLFRGDKTLHITFHCRIPKETLLEKVEVVAGIIKEVYKVPQVRVQIQQELL
ncbi:MAG: hypothetical protein A3J54_00195 [Candidatus Ryanbacteria bacterium RIFCSPHIGHO2_02_FULL_45_13b]|uniref:Uncharacterized protein n=1 Tax=Candidatus Ryanbacteria bacterium RIFCSPHIGHO2_02_FULL_45_13b TaxID=1802117 RepID=A0A1G2G9I8_9BACT|nr:MAG: hypothetical protein A3J54_00195 [Candidatus Ryanbacteria bacterium RIFCSPHIGHO2_02_FULL_45_13b]